MDIRILPSNIANLIAAGEVIQRPSAVVKELMENAVDAGATSVSVIVTDAGRTAIQVIDNGCGMGPEDAVVCFEKHATSKISAAEDLESILTYGFRGEALASIAAVAQVTLKTRREQDETGCVVQFADSRHISTEEAAVPKGANFLVRNIFYNVPGRRKYLKSDAVELKHIVEEFTRVALSNPGTAFSLNANGRDIYNLKAAKSLKYRIQDILGPSAVDKVVDVQAETSVVKMEGYVCRPDLSRKTLGNQFFFVNGRYFRSPYLHKAVMKAYENLIPDGTTPSYFLWFECDPHEVDVNISPTKTEVKFADESVIFQVVWSCIKEAVGRNSFGSAIEFGEGGVQDLPVFGKNYESFRPEALSPNPEFDPSYNPFEQSGAAPVADRKIVEEEFPDAFAGAYSGGAPVERHSYAAPKRQEYSVLFDGVSMPSASVLVVQGKYIVSQVKSGMLVINIRRAWERIHYERFLNAVSKNAPVSGQQLFPVQVTVGQEGRMVFEANQELLHSLGFDIAPFGTDTVVVNALPEGLPGAQEQVEATLAELMIALEENHSGVRGIMESAMAERFARIAAGRGGESLSPMAAQRLIDTLFACSNSEYTASGHRIMTILTIEDIDKKF